MIGLSKKGGDDPKSITMVDCSKENKDVKGKSVAHADAQEEKSHSAAEEVDIVALDTTPFAKEAATTSSTIATTKTTISTTTTTVMTAQAVMGEQEAQSSTVSQVKRALET